MCKNKKIMKTFNVSKHKKSFKKIWKLSNCKTVDHKDMKILS